MFPPVVRFSWKRRWEKKPAETKVQAEGEQLELRESGRSAAIKLVDVDALYTYKYSCYVQHELGTVEAPTEQVVPAINAEREPAEHELSFQPRCRVKLLCVLYTVLTVKSLLYCCGLSLLISLRNQGASTSRTPAD